MKNLLILLLLYIQITAFSCNKYTKEGCKKDENGNEVCEKPSDFVEVDDDDDDDEPMFYEVEDKLKTRARLFQWDPVEVGHEREIEVAQGQLIKLKTVAMRPKAFVIDNFLTNEECDHIIDKAKHFGMGESGLHIDEKIAKHKTYTFGQAKSTFGNFRHWDVNYDGVISMKEVVDLAKRDLRLYINSTHAEEMFEVLKIKASDQNAITRDEFNAMNTAGIAEYLNELRESHPQFRDRFSEQTWLKQGDHSDHIMRNLREKVLKLTGLPPYYVHGGEPLQVLRYQPFGHYNAHFDSMPEKEYPDHKCCHMDLETQPFRCKLCRFITIIYYLNDVEEGGETAFPAADDPNYNHEQFKKRNNGKDLYNLSEFCYESKLVVKPKKGRAVMWYNHEVDENGYMGEMDYYSLHGGCDVRKGVKWMANNWLVAAPSKYAHLDNLYIKLAKTGAH